MTRQSPWKMIVSMLTIVGFLLAAGGTGRERTIRQNSEAQHSIHHG